MFDKFGEFNTVEELNKKAAELKQENKGAELKELAKENGLDEEEAEDFMDGLEELATPLMAAAGKLKVESENYEIKGILEDWKDSITTECMGDREMMYAVRSKGKSLAECMAKLIRFAFENKVQVSDKIVNITKVTHNGHEEAMRKPLYLGIPNKAQVKKIIREYYLG